MIEDQEQLEKRKIIELQIHNLKELFGNDCKLNLLVRFPNEDVKTMLIAEDSLDEVFRLVTMMKINAEKNVKKNVDILIPKVIV